MSDLGIFDLLREREGARLLLHSRLHAKILLVDDAQAAVGSANVTDAALGFAGPPNAEVVVTLRPVPNRLFLFLVQLEAECVPATEDLRRQFEEAMKAAPPPGSYPDVPLPDRAPPGPLVPFPQFRSPERLYRGYLSVVEFGDQETRGAVLQDLRALSLPDGLDESAFRANSGRDRPAPSRKARRCWPKLIGPPGDWVIERQATAASPRAFVSAPSAPA